MGWREEERIANEIEWAREDITYEIQALREAQNRASRRAESSPSSPILSRGTIRKIIKITIIFLLVFGALFKIGMGIIILLYKG